MSERVDGARMPMAVGETALLLVHLSVIAGFARLFEDASFLAPLACFAVGAHLLSVVTRRRRVAAPLVLLIALAGAAVTTAWVLFPDTTRLGLPTAETWDRAGEALRLSRAEFDQVAAPAPVLDGFLLASGLALWAAAWFADWAAFRLRATVEAVTPAAVLFVFGSLLGSGEHRTVSAVAFAAAVLVFVASHRALRAQLDQAWLTTSPVVGPRAVLRAGVALAAVAVLGGTLVGPRLPGSEAEPVVRWRAEARGGGDRSTVSPIVDLRKRLVNQSDTMLFTVQADRPAYWRLTSLDRFDGVLWSSGGTFAEAEGRLEPSGPIPPGAIRNEQRFRIRALDAIWVPAAFEARDLVSNSAALRWDPDSSTLIMEDDTTSDGTDYRIVSDTGFLDPAALARVGDDDDPATEERYGSLPSSFPDEAAEAARTVTAGATTRYDHALALQDWFRDEFTYSVEPEAGHGNEALVGFLESREGYCEQFAGAYAAMARSLGIPSRVAVGFTPGDADPDGSGLYRVRGRHAHAWPELWFPGAGWVPFEPTPGRGMPDAEAHTGVAPAQDDVGDDEEPAATTTTTTLVPGATTVPPTTTPADAPTPDDQLLAGADPEDEGGPSGLVTALALGVGAAALWAGALLAAPALRARRRRAHGEAASAVLDAWHGALAPVRWLTGLRPRPSETHDEFARRAHRSLGDRGDDLVQLAALATAAAWDPAGAVEDAAPRAEELRASIAAEAARHDSRLTRARRRLSWREAFDRPRPQPA